jgi:hypothetical protein
MGSSSRSPSRSLWSSLGTLLALLSWCGLGPARATLQHVHHWTQASPPQALIAVKHLDGQAVTPGYPAVRCEILRIHWLGGGVEDIDACDAEGHAGDPQALDGECVTIRWRDYPTGGPDVPGKFGVMVDGVFTPTESYNEVNGRMYGLTSATHYKVGRTHAGEDLSLAIELDDSGTVYVGQNQLPAFDDPKTWQQMPLMPVEGSGCVAIKVRRDVLRNELGYCKVGTEQAGNSSIVPWTGTSGFKFR